ncbi:MAG: hypothetical protein H8E70_10540 [Candidatus Marinimicrobia bacterium]|nr:hypothetical protein [Candidatus Neomarinimicrobiota bacterium]
MGKQITYFTTLSRLIVYKDWIERPVKRGASATLGGCERSTPKVNKLGLAKFQ